MNTIILFLIHRLVSWAAGITPAQFRAIVERVEHAERQFSSSADKGAHVRKIISATWPKLAGWLVNLLLELAVTSFKRGVVR